MSAPDNPCTRCGACCASFRVDFSREEWAGGFDEDGVDGDEHGGAAGRVPVGLAEPLNAGLCRMRGTDRASPRCAALWGTVGQRVQCTIHEWRPSPCREFGLRAPLGIGDEACDAARRRHGLPPLSTPGS